jgi:dual-specificity kinase
LFCGQEVENISRYAPSEHITNSLFKGVARNGSPPWRDDDKDGHYMFELGDNLTSRCNYTLPLLIILHSYVMVGSKIII